MAENIEMPEMTWTEVDEAIKDRPVGLLPVGAIEAHGPHLPVSTATLIAQEMARRGAAKLKEHGLPSLILPPVSFMVAEYGAAFPGTISLPRETAVALVRDVCTVSAKRLRCVAVVNVNQEPSRVECLKAAVEEARKAGASVCYVDVTKKRWAELLGETFAQGDHGGAFETSLLMAAAPDQVRERERISLAPTDGLAAGLKKGAKNFADAGGEDAYFGDPTAASAEEGEGYYETLAEILTLSVMEHLGSKAS
jgi:creatinine amidohydrolase